MSDFLEKNLEDMIFQNRRILANRGFPAHESNMIRQMPIPSGGRVDLFSYELEGGDTIRCTVFELKKGRLDAESVLQVSQYASEIQRLLQPYFQNITVKKVLVGNDYSLKFTVLFEYMETIEVYLYKYLVDGIRFKKSQRLFEIEHPEIITLLNTPSESNADFLKMLIDNYPHQIYENGTH